MAYVNANHVLNGVMLMNMMMIGRAMVISIQTITFIRKYLQIPTITMINSLCVMSNPRLTYHLCSLMLEV